jgi:predicted Zn-dependent peptidase
MRAAVLLLASLIACSQAAAQQPQPPRDAFAGFETVVLPNGLKVWFQRLPGDPTVSVSISVAAGSDQDPPGLEQLAHFTEHMLFSDHQGRTEAQIKREIEERGGTYNGITFWDHTFYYALIGKAHGPFAIDWLYRLVSPHAMDPAVVERQRRPVAVELGAQPRQLGDWLWAAYLDPPALRLFSFWRKEFGLRTPGDRDYYPYRSLTRISPGDLRRFYETYYAPSNMTLTVIGDLDRDTVLARIGATFATLPARPAPAPGDSLRDPGRRRAEFFWSFRSDVGYDSRYKIYGLTGRQHLMLLFLSRWLYLRLNDRLRFQDRKAVYTLGSGVERRGPATYLYVYGDIKGSEFAFARGVIEHEIEALRRGTIPDSAFAADRATVARQLLVQNASAKDLERWVVGQFYDGRLHRDFPDLVAFFDTVTKAEVGEFARRYLVSERQVLRVVDRLPLSQGVFALALLALLWLAVQVARRLLRRPVDMTRIRYVARFRYPLAYKLVVLPAFLAALALVVRILAYGCELLADRLLLGIGVFWVQAGAYACMAGAMVVVVLLGFALLPRKLLCFDDGAAIKYLAYRSVPVGAGEIVEASSRRFAEVWLSGRLWRCVPLTFGLFAPGIYLRLRGGRSYFFRVRDVEECLGVLAPLSRPRG